MTEGSSKGIEKEAALRFVENEFNVPIALSAFRDKKIVGTFSRETGMLSDGNSVTYKAVCDANFYPVRKLECVPKMRCTDWFQNRADCANVTRWQKRRVVTMTACVC